MYSEELKLLEEIDQLYSLLALEPKELWTNIAVLVPFNCDYCTNVLKLKDNVTELMSKYKPEYLRRSALLIFFKTCDDVISTVESYHAKALKKLGSEEHSLRLLYFMTLSSLQIHLNLVTLFAKIEEVKAKS
jgi:hypothetical protein